MKGIILADVSVTKLYPINSSEYSTAPKRPFYSVLNKCKFKNKFGIEISYLKKGFICTNFVKT